MHTRNLCERNRKQIISYVAGLVLTQAKQLKIYIQLITSSSAATCLKCRWNFLSRLRLNGLRLISLEALSLDRFGVAFESRLEYVDEFSEMLAVVSCSKS